MDRSVGFWIALVGVALVVVGVLVSTGALSWFGRLPGDIRYSRDGVRVFVPITSMILVSVVLTLLLRLFGR